MAKTLKERKERWIDLYRTDGHTEFVFLVGCGETGGPPRPAMWPQLKRERIEWAWESYVASLKQTEWLDDDFIPFMSVTSGTEIFAEAFGAGVHRPSDNMPFAIPFIHSPAEAEKIKKPKLEDTPLTLMFEMADELVKRSGKGVPLQLPDMQSPMDVVAQMWDKTDLFPSMIEAPEAVKELAGKIRDLQCEFLDLWFSKYGNEYIAHFPQYFMRGGITMSVDEIGSVSGEMFDDFFMDELTFLSKRYGCIGVHCCADARHQWDRIKKIPGLVMLNLCQPAEVIDESYDYFSNSVAMWPMRVNFNPDAPAPRERTYEELKGCRLVISGWGRTKEDAIKTLERLKRYYRQ